MRNKSTALILKSVYLILPLLPAMAAADIGYSLTKRQIFHQTSSTAPTTASAFGLMATFDGQDGSFTNVTFSGNGRSGQMVNVGAPGEAIFDYIDDSYTSLAALDAAWANNTTYTFTHSGGTTSGSHNVVFQGGSFATSTPTLTGNSWQNAQNVNPDADLQLTWQAANWGTGGIGQFIFIEISGSNGFYEEFEVDTAATQIVIPNNTFDSLSQYTVQIHFAKIYSIEEGGTYEGMAGYINTLSFDLHTVPEPATVASVLGALALAGTLIVRRNKRRNNAA